ncbi:hypothetical protein [Oryzihumus leptocrescens]|nr:hypothetical protein [Oryzihumus leptocrescens]
MPPRGPVAAGAVLLLALSGCAATGSTGAMNGPGMMGDASAGYHFSRLSCSAPTSLPGSTVRVVLADMGMSRMVTGTAPLRAHMMLRATPGTVTAGQVSLVVTNMGWRTHEVVVLPLPAGTVEGQRIPGPDGKVDETGSLGEASASCTSGTGEGIRAGTAGWTTVTLPPGRYELVCNLANHYADGMHQELDVVPRA